MFVRIFGSLRAHIKQKAVARVNALEAKIAAKFTLPDKYKGTVVEKWAKYWSQLGIDYKDVAVGVVQQTIAKPVRSTVYASVGTAAYYCAKNNPSEVDYLRQVRQMTTELVLVHENSLNKETAEHMKFIERGFNEKRLRYMNVGLFSFMWLDRFDAAVGLYESNCTFTKPEILRFRERIVDFGFLNRWWILRKKMNDFDVPE